MEKVTFAAGCFWGLQLDFDKVDGVLSTTVGYIGGTIENPTYEAVCSGTTHHAEAVEIIFDPERVSEEQLFEIFWRCHNPTTLNRQGLDRGSQYRSAIFYYSERQRQIARISKGNCEASRLYADPIVTEITEAGQFWPAEEYHQKYLAKHNGALSCH